MAFQKRSQTKQNTICWDSWAHKSFTPEIHPNKSNFWWKYF